MNVARASEGRRIDPRVSVAPEEIGASVQARRVACTGVIYCLRSGVVNAHRGASPIWEEALRESGSAGRGEVNRACRNSADGRFLVGGVYRSAFRCARRRGEARVIPRMTHPETTITRPHHRFTLKPRSPSGADPEEENIPVRTIVTP